MAMRVQRSEGANRKDLLFPWLLPKLACRFQLLQGKKLGEIWCEELVSQEVEIFRYSKFLRSLLLQIHT